MKILRDYTYCIMVIALLLALTLFLPFVNAASASPRGAGSLGPRVSVNQRGTSKGGFGANTAVGRMRATGQARERARQESASGKKDDPANTSAEVQELKKTVDQLSSQVKASESEKEETAKAMKGFAKKVEEMAGLFAQQMQAQQQKIDTLSTQLVDNKKAAEAQRAADQVTFQKLLESVTKRFSDNSANMNKMFESFTKQYGELTSQVADIAQTLNSGGLSASRPTGSRRQATAAPSTTTARALVPTTSTGASAKATTFSGADAITHAGTPRSTKVL